MNLQKHNGMMAFAVISALTATAPIVSARATQDKKSAEPSTDNARTIKGVWRTVVTGRNCQTGEALGSLPGLFTFNEGGTMSEYGIGPGSSPALRSPGHGVWQREHRRHEYSFAFTYYRYNPGGIFIGSQKVTGALELGPGHDEFGTTSAIEVFDVNGNPIGAGCATAAGTRFE
jgi:hypothetical protein